MLGPYPFKKIDDFFKRETEIYNSVNEGLTGFHFSYALLDSQDIENDSYIFILNLQHTPTRIHETIVDVMPYYEDNKLLLEFAMSTLVNKLYDKLA